MLPFWLVEALFWAAVAALAVLAYVTRRRALFCVATLAFLPFLPAAFRYLLADPNVSLPPGGESTRVFVIAAMSFLPVWIGFGAGLLFDWLNAGIPAAPSKSEASPEGQTDRNWRESLPQARSDVEEP